MNLKSNFFNTVSRSHFALVGAFLLVAGLLFSLPLSKALANYGDKHYFGFTGITSDTAFSVRSPLPFEYGINSTEYIDGANSKFLQVQHSVYIDNAEFDTDTISKIGFKFVEINGNTGLPYSPARYGCPLPSNNQLEQFKVLFVKNTDIADWDNFSATEIGSAFSFGFDSNTSSLQADGTCLMNTQNPIISADIGAGYYTIIIQSQNGLFAGDDDKFWSPMGNPYITNAHQLICPSNRLATGMSPAYPYSFLDDSGSPNGCSDMKLVSNELTRQFSNFDFYFIEGEDLAVPPAITEEGVSCGLFSNSISTLYLNLNFSFGRCFRSLITWTFIPSQDTLENFNNLDVYSRAPFSYINDIPVLIDELFNSSATETLSVGINLSEIDPNASDIDIFNASRVADIPFYEFIYQFIVEWLLS